MPYTTTMNKMDSINILVDKYHGASRDQRIDDAIYRLLTTIAVPRWKENIENINMSKMGMYYNKVL